MGLVVTATDFVKNARIVRGALEYATVPLDYLRTCRRRGDETPFSAVHTYVMFIGIGRSGTTLLGALLDAHPRIVIANQQTTLKYLRPPLFTRAQIFHLLMRNARRAAGAGRRGGGGYRYAVAGQWQGRCESLEVIGDKSKSAQAVTWLTASPRLLYSLARTTRGRIRMIHAIRNPYDTIATRSRRRGLSLERITREYFALCERLQRLIGQIEATEQFNVARIPVHLEAFIAQPAEQLTAICEALGVAAGDDYVRACRDILYGRPHQSRRKVAWRPELIEQIAQRIAGIPFLRRYRFDD
jgi:hypothetical protein